MTTALNPGKREFTLPDGRTLHLWVMTLDDHVCVDIWTTRGREREQVSLNTGDLTRAPMGMFAWCNGWRRAVEPASAGLMPTGDEIAPFAVIPGETHDWPGISTVSLLWDTP